MVRAMCGVQLKDRKIAKDLMMLGLNVTIDSFGHCSVCWHSRVMRLRGRMSKEEKGC